jgi:dihydroorotase-like cyclic amidohydrolase
MLLIKNGMVHDAVHKEPYKADVLCEGTVIKEIGKDLKAENAEVIDAEGNGSIPGIH